MKRWQTFLFIIVAYALGWAVGSHFLSARAITILTIVLWVTLMIRMWKA
jgi:hypothetical protein